MTWDPSQYNRFAAEREQPFWDLASLLQPTDEPPNIVDLGCGDGRLTAVLHARLGARSTLGIDSSPSMLNRPEPTCALRRVSRFPAQRVAVANAPAMNLSQNVGVQAARS